MIFRGERRLVAVRPLIEAAAVTVREEMPKRIWTQAVRGYRGSTNVASSAPRRPAAADKIRRHGVVAPSSFGVVAFFSASA